MLSKSHSFLICELDIAIAISVTLFSQHVFMCMSILQYCSSDRVKQLGGQPQVVVQGEEGHSLQTHHHDLYKIHTVRINIQHTKAVLLTSEWELRCLSIQAVLSVMTVGSFLPKSLPIAMYFYLFLSVLRNMLLFIRYCGYLLSKFKSIKVLHKLQLHYGSSPGLSYWSTLVLTVYYSY